MGPPGKAPSFGEPSYKIAQSPVSGGNVPQNSLAIAHIAKTALETRASSDKRGSTGPPGGGGTVSQPAYLVSDKPLGQGVTVARIALH